MRIIVTKNAELQPGSKPNTNQTQAVGRNKIEQKARDAQTKIVHTVNTQLKENECLPTHPKHNWYKNDRTQLVTH